MADALSVLALPPRRIQRRNSVPEERNELERIQVEQQEIREQYNNDEVNDQVSSKSYKKF